MKVKAESRMKLASRCFVRVSWIALPIALLSFLPSAYAQSCQTATDLEDATRSAITAAAQRYFAMADKNDAASLRQSAIPSLASDFAGIENTVRYRQPELSGPQATVKSVSLLDGSTPSPYAEDYCV